MQRGFFLSKILVLKNVRENFAIRNVSEIFEWRLKSGLRAEGEQACWRARLCSLLNASKQAGEPLHGGVEPADSGDTRLEGNV